MTGETSDACATSSESTRVPTAYKAIVHGLSLLLPPLLCLLLMMCPEDMRRDLLKEGAWLPLSMAGMMFVWTLLLYAIAGGFEWKPGGIGCGRTVLYALLGGVLFAIPLFILWVLIRVICAVAFRVPIAVGAGKIWVSGEGTDT